jgi:hypothetical protein
MAKPKSTSDVTATGRKIGKRKIVVFGPVTRKVKKAGATTSSTETYTALISMSERALLALNATEATAEQINAAGWSPNTPGFGEKGGKVMRCLHPDKKGKNGADAWIQVPIPAGATIKKIQKFLTPLKTEWFRLDGRQYPASE